MTVLNIEKPSRIHPKTTPPGSSGEALGTLSSKIKRALKDVFTPKIPSSPPPPLTTAIDMTMAVSLAFEGATDIHSAIQMKRGTALQKLEAGAVGLSGSFKIEGAALGAVATLGKAGAFGATRSAAMAGMVASIGASALGGISGLAVVSALSIQLHRARMLMNIVENSENKPPLEVLNDLLNSTEPEKTERKRNSFANIVGDNLAEAALNALQANDSRGASLILKACEKVCYKKIIDKGINIALSLGGTITSLVIPSFGVTLVLIGVTAVYTALANQIGEACWKNREQKRAQQQVVVIAPNENGAPGFEIRIPA